MKVLKTASCIAIFFATSITGISVVKGLGIIKSKLYADDVAVTETVPVSEPVQSFERILPPVAASFGSAASFDPTGYYFVDSEKEVSTFSEVEIEINAREYDFEKGVYANTPIVPHGKLRNGKEFLFTRIAIGDREIAFETETVDGIKYEFVGHFPLKPETVCEGCEYPPDLKGTLRKLKGGKVVEAAAFDFYIGGC